MGAVPGTVTTVRVTTPGTATADSSCANCATDSWATSHGACAVKTTCGAAVPGADALRATTTVYSATSDTVCAACADGTFAVGVGACTACTVVADSLADTALTCTSATDSRVVACASAKRKTVGVDAVAATTDPVVAATAGTADTCTTTAQMEVSKLPLPSVLDVLQTQMLPLVPHTNVQQPIMLVSSVIAKFYSTKSVPVKRISAWHTLLVVLL